MKRTILLLCSVALLAACQSKKEENTGVTKAVVKLYEVTGTDEQGVRQFPCKVKASSEINIAFKVAGTLKRIAVSEGQHVAAGQLLAEMDDTDYRIQLAATEAEYAQIKADAERVIKLYEQDGTTASNYDKARFGLQQIEAKLRHHRNQLEYCRIYAPVTGTVQTRLFEGGETIAAGMPVLQLVGNGLPEAEITVPASVRQSLAGVCDAAATFNAMGDNTYKLRLLHVLPKANANGMYPVRLAIEGSPLPSPGMSGWVTLTCSDNSSACIKVPSTAILHNESSNYIYKVSDGKSQKTKVDVVSLTGDGMAEIEGNVSVGDKVVASGVHNIEDRQPVEELAKTSATNIGGLL